MVWGQSATRGIEDLVQRVASNDPKLQSLTILRQRRFGHEDVAALALALKQNTTLTELYASSHPLSPASVQLLAEALPSTALRSLCVGDSSLGDGGVVALAQGVASSPSLTSLDLTGKGLGHRGAAALASALRTSSSLSHLLLNSNPQLGNEGFSAIFGAAANTSSAGTATEGAAPAEPSGGDWACSEVVLEAQGCGVGAGGLAAAAEADNNCGKLRELHLQGNPLGLAGAQALCQLLQKAHHLQSLHLRGTDLGDEGGEVLASGLKPTASALQAIDAADCGLGSKTMAALSKAFSAGMRLHQLVLAGNPAIADADVAHLGASLASSAGSSSLGHLDLTGTQAGSLAVQSLSSVPGLKHLSLVGCPLGAAGGTALAASLSTVGGSNSSWPQLEELCISGTGLSISDTSAVFTALAAGGAPCLKSLEVGANPATQDEGFQAQLEALRCARADVAVFWRSGDDPAPAVQL